MRTLAFLAFVSNAALGQELEELERRANPDEMQVGADMSFSPADTVLRYDLPEPVGWVELRFTSPGGGEFIAGGSLQFRGKEVVELPRTVLACTRAPRVGSTSLNTVYIIPEAGEAAWFDAFWTRIVIPFGYGYDQETDTTHMSTFPELHLEYVGNTLRRVVAARSASQKDVLDVVPSAAQCESLAIVRQGAGR